MAEEGPEVPLASPEPKAKAKGKAKKKKERKHKDGEKHRPVKQNQPPPEEVDFDDPADVWEYYLKPDAKGFKYNFFGSVKLDHSAGFDEIDDFFTASRYLYAVIAIGLALYNWVTLIQINSALLEGAFATPVDGDGQSGGQLFLLSIRLLEAFGVDDGNKAGLVFTAIMELLVMSFFILRLVQLGIQAALADTECKKWWNLSRFFWQAFPIAASVSAVRLLNYVTPAVIMGDFANLSARADCKFRFFPWLIMRLLAGLIGFDAFLFKFQGLRTSMTTSGISDFQVFTFAGMFLYQMLGIVQIGLFTRERIFLFIFAGVDSQLSLFEQAKKSTWESLFMKHVWNSTSWHKAIAFYFTFGDTDFQSLALDSTGAGLLEQQEKLEAAEKEAAEKAAAEKAAAEQAAAEQAAAEQAAAAPAEEQS